MLLVVVFYFCLRQSFALGRSYLQSSTCYADTKEGVQSLCAGGVCSLTSVYHSGSCTWWSRISMKGENLYWNHVTAAAPPCFTVWNCSRDRLEWYARAVLNNSTDKARAPGLKVVQVHVAHLLQCKKVFLYEESRLQNQIVYYKQPC